MPALVSCVMPAYNHAPYVADAVRSVLTDDSTGLVELIAVDDASSDATGAVLRELAAELPGLTVLHNDRNLGLVPTLRRALQHATGTYVTALASDDRWLPGRLASQLAPLESGAQWSFGRAHVIDALGRRTSTEPQGWPPDQDGMLPMLLRGQAIYAPTLMYRRDLLDRVGGVANALWEDLAVSLRFAALAEPTFHPEPLVEYRVHGANVHLGISGGGRHFAAHAQAVRLLLDWDALPAARKTLVAEHDEVWSWLERYAAGAARLREVRSLPRRPLAAVLGRQAEDLLRHRPRADAHRLEAALRLAGAREAADALAVALGGPLWVRAGRRARAIGRR